MNKAITVQIHGPDTTEPGEFIERVYRAAAGVPTIHGERLPVEVAVSSLVLTWAMRTAVRPGSDVSVLDHVARLMPDRSSIVSYGSYGEKEEAIAWGEELIGILRGHPDSAWPGKSQDPGPVVWSRSTGAEET